MSAIVRGCKDGVGSSMSGGLRPQVRDEIEFPAAARGTGGRLKTPEGRVTRVPNRAKIAEKVRDSCNSSLRTQGFETVSDARPFFSGMGKGSGLNHDIQYVGVSETPVQIDRERVIDALERHRD